MEFRGMGGGVHWGREELGAVVEEGLWGGGSEGEVGRVEMVDMVEKWRPIASH